MVKDGNETLDVIIGGEIQRTRSAANFSRNDLAKALGVSYQQVHKYEKGKSALTFSRLAQIATFLNVPLIELVPDYETRSRMPTGFLRLPEGLTVPTTQADLELARSIARIDDQQTKEALIALVDRVTRPDEGMQDAEPLVPPLC